MIYRYNFNRVIALFITTVLLFNLIPTQINIVEAINDIYSKFIRIPLNDYSFKFSTSTGSIEDPYVITTPQELQNIENDKSSNYILGNDIDMSGFAVGVDIVSANINNNVNLVTDAPAKEDDIRLYMNPGEGFINGNTIIINEGTVNQNLGFISGVKGSNKGYFKLSADLYSDLSETKIYSGNYNVIMRINPTNSSSITNINNIRNRVNG